MDELIELNCLTSETGGTAASLVEAGASVVAAAVAEQVVGALGVDDGRDGLGVAVGAQPVALAHPATGRVAPPVAVDTVVRLHTAHVARRTVHVGRTHRFAALAVRARRTRARELATSAARAAQRARAAVEARVWQALDDARARRTAETGRAAAHRLVADAPVAERAVHVVA